MPCWVAPSVAAELWGMPLDHVMARVEEGSVLSKTEAGFLFVDIMPEAQPAPASVPLTPPPATFMSVSDAELEALALPAPATFSESPVFVEATIKYAEDEEDGEEPFVDEESPDFSAKDWRRVRAQTARLRKPPARMVEVHAA